MSSRGLTSRTMSGKEKNPLLLQLKGLTVEELGNDNNILQSGFWGAFKAHSGWTARGFAWEYNGFSGRFLVLERHLLRIVPMAYVPYGPCLPATMNAGERSRFLVALARELKAHLSRGCFAVRFDLDSESCPSGLYPPLRRSPYRVQPQDTVLLNLDTDEAELLANMHKKTRYNIRLSEKKGVEVHRYQGNQAEDILESWYRLYRETAERDGITLHPLSYYQRLFNLSGTYAGQAPEMSLYMAMHERDALAGIIVAHWGERATYMYGASGGHKRSLMPNHLLQWVAIQNARNEGCREYDFFGIPPADDPSHPMHGLWRFKTGFGGRIVHYQGAWDYSYRPIVYALYRLAESLRGYLATVRKKR